MPMAHLRQALMRQLPQAFRSGKTLRLSRGLPVLLFRASRRRLAPKAQALPQRLQDRLQLPGRQAPQVRRWHRDQAQAALSEQVRRLVHRGLLPFRRKVR